MHETDVQEVEIKHGAPASKPKSRSHSDFTRANYYKKCEQVVANDLEPEHEGRYMELERRLLAGDWDRNTKEKKGATLDTELGQRQSDRTDAEGEYQYETQGTGVYQSHLGYDIRLGWLQHRQKVDDQSNQVQGRDAEWQDYEDYKPDYSGYQSMSQHRNFLSSANPEREGERSEIKGIRRKSAASRLRGNRTKVFRKKAVPELRGGVVNINTL
jgi:hypothetical protein